MGLLRSDKTSHDRVAIISFQDRSARVLLGPTRSTHRVRRALTEVYPGGSTPLAAGLAEAARLIRVDAMRSRHTASVLLLLSDGRGNVPFRNGGNAAQDAARGAEELVRAGTYCVVVDTAPAEESHDAPRALAEALSGAYHWIGAS